MSDSTSVVRHQSGGVSLSDPSTFEIVTKQAAMLARSTIIPESFQGQPANVLVAMEYAYRLGASVLAVMQNVDVIYGRPALRSTFLIGTVNASGRFTPLRFRFQGEEGTPSWGCRCVAKDKASGEECVGPLITLQLAKDEGWIDRKGSKWKTSPELMLTYRSASWWTRIFCPEIALGLHTADEVEDMPLPPVDHASTATTVLAALHAGDEPTATPDGAPVVEAVLERDPGQHTGTTAAEGDPGVPAAVQRVHAKYFAMLEERGMGDTDRHAFQKRLHGAGLVQAESCTGWVKQDYLSAMAELEQVPLAPEVAG